MARTPNLGLELFTPLGEGWREDATAGLLLDENMALIDAALGYAGSSVSVNSASVANPNFVNSATVTFSVTGSSVSATATGLSGTPALPSGTTAATVPNPSDASANVATDAFVQSAIELSMGTVPLNLAGKIGPATYSFACLGTGSQVNFTASGGAVNHISIWSPFVGSGYKAGDLVSVAGGNNDAILAISAVGGAGYPTSGVILYGGTGYTTGTSAAVAALSSIPFTFLLSGALSGNIEFLMTPGTYQTQSNQWIFCNNCTGAYTITIAVSNSTNTGAAGGRTVVIPPGTNNSSSTFVQTDGELNVDLVVPDSWQSLNGTYLGETQLIPWNGPTAGTPDTGISRLGAASLAVGNGTAGDYSGTVVATLFKQGSSDSTDTALGLGAFSTGVGVQNTAVGYDALSSTSHVSGQDAYYNTAVGYESLAGNTTGSANTCIGHRAGLLNTTGFANTAVGNDAFEENTTGAQNTAIGYDALNSGQTLDGNTAVGWQALKTVTTGGFNTAIGTQAGGFVSNGGYIASVSYSVFVGNGAYGPLSNGDTDEIVIAGGSGETYGAGSYTAVIGDAETTDVYFGSSSATSVIHAAGFYTNGNLNLLNPNAATASSVPTRGLGATNAAVVIGNGGISGTLDINVGDCVLVFVTSNSTLAAPSDNGANGGNVYAPLGSARSVIGAAQAYICLSATVSATSIANNAASGGGYCSLTAATFLNVASVGNIAYSIPSYSSPNISSSTSVTTTQASSLVVGCTIVGNLSAYSGSSGSVIVTDFPGGYDVGSAMQTLSAPTITSYTVRGSGTENPDAFSTQMTAWAIELRSGNQASPVLIFTGKVWDSAGPSSIADTWTVQDVIANATDGASILTFAHTGSSGTAAVQVPLLDIGATDTGISRLGAASLAIGNGTAGDFSGTLSLATLVIVDTTNVSAHTDLSVSNNQPGGRANMIFNNDISSQFGLELFGSTFASFKNSALFYVADGSAPMGSMTFATNGNLLSGGTTPIFFSAGGNSVVPQLGIFPSGVITIGGASGGPLLNNFVADTGISRLGAASLAIGNGTQGDFTGSLKLTGLNVQGSQTGPYSVSLTAQAATIAATNLVTTPVTTALYEITYYLNDTTAGTSGTVSLTITWNDGGSQTFTSSNVTFGTLGAYVSGTIVVKATSGAIKYATTVTSAVGSPAYSLDIRVKQLA